MPTHAILVSSHELHFLNVASATVLIPEDCLFFYPPCHLFNSRGVGCILYEMATGRPMFPGATVKEELHLIFRLMGKRAALLI